MNILKKFFGQKRPTLKKEDISDFEKVSKFVVWYLKNEPIANALNNPSNNIIYNEGFRPLLKIQNIDDLPGSQINTNTILKWFGIKFFFDINQLKEANKNEFKLFIDNLLEFGNKTLSTAGKIGIKYNINFQNSTYKKEIEKITDSYEREIFKSNYLTDNVLGAEIRILAWLYKDYFGESYKLKRNQAD